MATRTFTVRPRSDRPFAPRLRPVAFAAALLLGGPAALAVPPVTQLPVVAPGGAQINATVGTPTGGPKPSLTVTQTQSANNRGLVEWQSFSVGQDAKVIFNQPNAQSVLINRVTGTPNGVPASEIFGGISANGRIFLVNPTGIVIGPNAAVNVGSLVATTLDLSSDMTANNYANAMGSGELSFVGAAGRGTSLQVMEAADSTLPQIVAGEGGSIVLLGRDGIQHYGSASAAKGAITLSTATAATLTVPVTSSGYIEVATSTPTTGGNILVGSGSQTVASGGRITVGAAGKEGGARSDSVTIAGTLSTDSSTGAAGSISVQAGNAAGGSLQVDSTATITASSSAGTGGSITLAGRDIGFSDGSVVPAAVRAPGRVSAAAAAPGGNRVLAEGSTGGGHIAIGDANTTSLFVSRTTTISADATGNGNGGDVSLRALYNQAPGGTAPAQPRVDFGVLEMYGAVTARGGSAGGNGGTIETSGTAMTTALGDGAGGMYQQGSVDAAARSAGGKAGTWTLDPFDVTISTNGSTSVDGSFNPTGPGANVRAADISAALDGGTSVNISTGTAGSGSATGRITLADGTAIVRSAGTTATTLTLQAHDSVSLGNGSSITVNGGGPLNVRLLSDLDGNGTGNVSLAGSTVTTGGGNVTLGGGTAPDDGGFARGNGEIAGVSISGGSIDTRGNGGAGNVLIRGAATGSEAGVRLDTSISANNITVVGRAGAGTGVQLNGNLDTAAGLIDVRGVATRVNDAGFQPVGLDIGSLSIAAGTGSVILAGRGDDAGLTNPEGGLPAIGLRYASLSITSATGSTGRITLAGEAANTTGGIGVQFNQGESSGLSIDGIPTEGPTPAGGADVVIGGVSPGGTALDLGQGFGLAVRTDGRVNLRPLGVDANGGLTEQAGNAIQVGRPADTSGQPGAIPADSFYVDPLWLELLGAENGGITAGQGVVIGSAGHTGAITVADNALLNHAGVALTLQNQGNGSAGIVLGGGNALGTLGLMTAGNVSQNGPGALTAGTVTIQAGGASVVDLSRADNQIGTLAFDPPGTLSVATAGNLVIDSGTALGFDAATGFAPLTITDSQGGASALLRAGGTVTLNRSIAMDNEVGVLDIVSPTQVIFGAGATLSAGTRWSLWTPGVTNLPATAQAVNYYGCVFGDAGTCSLSGVAIPTTGHQVFVPTQPTLTVTANAATGQPGQVPALTYTVSGLQNGDAAATAVTGTLATAATPNSPAGTYAITQGTLSSPTGYVVNFVGANLTLGEVLPLSNLDILGVTREALQSRFQSQFESGVYGRNLAQPYICTAASLIRGISADDKERDPLAAEWGKVRNQPQLSGCLDVADGGSCSAF